MVLSSKTVVLSISPMEILMSTIILSTLNWFYRRQIRRAKLSLQQQQTRDVTNRPLPNVRRKYLNVNSESGVVCTSVSQLLGGMGIHVLELTKISYLQHGMEWQSRVIYHYVLIMTGGS